MTTLSRASGRPAYLNALAFVAVAASLFGAYLGLRVSPVDINQGDLIRVMYAHVAVAWVSFAAVAVSAVAGIVYLWRDRPLADVVSVAAAEGALLFGALTIVGGMTYSKPTLGTFWTWDAKLTLTALMVALLVGVFVVRGLIGDPVRRGRVSAVVMLVVLASLPLNYLAAEWFRTLHPAKAIDLTGGGVTIEPIMLNILLFNVVAAGLMFAWLLFERIRLGVGEHQDTDAGTPSAPTEAVHV